MNPGIRRLAKREVESVEECDCDVEGRRTLDQLAHDETATIARICPRQSSAAARRLFDLGFVPGATVKRVRRAPMGDPATYRVADYEIALRNEQAHCIEVNA